jgi:hypothetical protein
MIPTPASGPPPIKRNQTKLTSDQEKTLWGAMMQHKPHLAAAGPPTVAAWEKVYEATKAHPFFSGTIISSRSVLEQKFDYAKKTLAKKLGQYTNTSGFDGEFPEHIKMLREICEAEEAHDEVVSMLREATKAKEAKADAAKTKTGLKYGCIEGPDSNSNDDQPVAEELDSEGVEGEIIERNQKPRRVRRSKGSSSVTATPSSGGTATPSSGGTAPLEPNDGDFGCIGASLEKALKIAQEEAAASQEAAESK